MTPSIIPYPGGRLIDCRVARISIGSAIITGIAHLIESNGHPDLRLYLTDRYVGDTEACDFGLAIG